MVLRALELFAGKDSIASTKNGRGRDEMMKIVLNGMETVLDGHYE